MPDPQPVDNPAPEGDGPTDSGTPAVTIVDDTTPAVTAPQDFPDNWRNLMAGDDEKSLKQLERINSPRDLAKSYREIQLKMSKGQAEAKLPVPNEESTPEDIAAYRAENNIPEKFEDYDLDFGDGTVIGDDTKEKLSGFLEFAHSKNLNNDSVKDTVKWFMDDLAAQQEALAVADQEAKVNGMADLKAEWGAEYQGNLNAMNSLFVNAPDGVKNALLAAKGTDGLSFGNNPDNIRWMVALAKELNPTATLVPPGPDQAASIDQEIKKIQGYMDSTDKKEKAKYWGDQSMQDRYFQLIEAKEKLK